MNKEETDSPYCEVCGHCGYIECCGIDTFIDKHIKGKTNCKNEEGIITDLINLCEYKDEVFRKNKQLQQRIDKAIEYIGEPASDFTYEDIKKILKILKGESNE